MTKLLKVAAMADLHIREDGSVRYKDIFSEISEKSDLLLLGGDLTDLGLVKEAEILVEDLTVYKKPVVTVLGNHDFESGQQEKVKKILQDVGVKILDQEPFEYEGVGFAGVKGFGGGFDNHMLGAFGEEGIKDFVKEAISESLKLENALNKLQAQKKVVLMHYSPIKETCIGEPVEIYPFLGSSRLVEPIERFGVKAVFHGHAHAGVFKGQTLSGVPVYNVSLPVLLRSPEKIPYAIIEI